MVTLPGFALLGNGTTFSITVLDLSYGGCRVETSIALMPGLRLKLSVLRLGALDAQVCWCSGGHAGLSFGAAAAAVTAREKPRRHERLKVHAEVSIRGSGRPNYRTRVFDLSPTGCKIEFVERPRAGDKIWTKLNGLDGLESEVRWVEGFGGGVEFVRAIHPAVFELLLARLNALGADE